MRIMRWIEGNFGLMMLISIGIGMIMPTLDFVPGFLIALFTAMTMFLAVSKINAADFAYLKIVPVSGFYAARFLILPVVLFYLISVFLPEYRFGLLFFFLLPAGVTLALMCALMNGNPALGLGMTCVSSLLAPFVIPPVFTFLSGTDIALDSFGMFVTLAWVIFVPVLLYVGMRRFVPCAVPVVLRHGSYVSILLMSITLVIIVSSQRDVILAEPFFALQAFVIGLIVYLALYFLGWFLYGRREARERIAYALMAGNNNIALGISLAFLYLPQREIIMMTAWEISWIVALAMFQYFVSKRTQG